MIKFYNYYSHYLTKKKKIYIFIFYILSINSLLYIYIIYIESIQNNFTKMHRKFQKKYDRFSIHILVNAVNSNALSFINVSLLNIVIELRKPQYERNRC